MNTKPQTNDAQPTAWAKLYHWAQALDEALDYDPGVHLHTSIQHLHGKVSHLEANVLRLETKIASRRGEGK